MKLSKNEISLVEEARMSPEMKALTPRQRLFVEYLLETGSNNMSAAAAAAGYSNSTNSVLSVTASRLAHDPKVNAAIRAEAIRRMQGAAILASSRLVEISQSADQKTALRAIEILMNRIGMHAITENRQVVQHTLDTEQTMAKIEHLAKKLGLDPKQLLGGQMIALPPVQDVEFEEVKPFDPREGLEDVLD